MVDLYCCLIVVKRKSFNDVPNAYKDAVRERLKELGYDINGDPLNGEVSV